MDSAAVAIRVENLSKAFAARSVGPATRLQGAASASASPRVAVDGVTLEVRRGEIFGLVGPNGSGKTTLLRLMAASLAPDGGRVRVFGHDAAEDPQAVHSIVNRAAVETTFFKRLSPLENLLYGARAYGLRPAETRRRALDMLRRLGLSERDIYRPMEGMSRGLQQKVAIARAFLAQPRVLLLDEPTTGLDPRARRDVHTFVRELRAAHGATVVLTTHDLHEAEALCDRVAIVVGGRLAALDTPAGLLQRAGPGPWSARPTLEDVYLNLTGSEAVIS